MLLEGEKNGAIRMKEISPTQRSSESLILYSLDEVGG